MDGSILSSSHLLNVIYVVGKANHVTAFCRPAEDSLHLLPETVPSRFDMYGSEVVPAELADVTAPLRSDLMRSKTGSYEDVHTIQINPMSLQESQGGPTKFFGTVEARDADVVSSLSFVLEVVIEVRHGPGLQSSLVNNNRLATAGFWSGRHCLSSERQEGCSRHLVWSVYQQTLLHCLNSHAAQACRFVQGHDYYSCCFDTAQICFRIHGMADFQIPDSQESPMDVH